MKTYRMDKVNPLISNVLIRLHIDQYLEESGSDLQVSHPSLMSIMAWAQLKRLPVVVDAEKLVDLERHIERLKATASSAQMADVTLIENWIRNLMRDQSEATSSEQIVAPAPRNWPNADAGVGFMVMLEWAKQDLSLLFDGGWQDMSREVPLEDAIYHIALGQLINQNNHGFMDLKYIEIVQSIALRKYLDGLENSHRSNSREAILVLSALSELWFKLFNGKSPQLTSDVISTGGFSITHATADSENDN